MSSSSSSSVLNRVSQLRELARSSHEGIYLTGPDQIELKADELPIDCFGGDNFCSRALETVAAPRMPKPFGNSTLTLECLQERTR